MESDNIGTMCSTATLSFVLLARALLLWRSQIRIVQLALATRHEPLSNSVMVGWFRLSLGPQLGGGGGDSVKKGRKRNLVAQIFYALHIACSRIFFIYLLATTSALFHGARLLCFALN